MKKPKKAKDNIDKGATNNDVDQAKNSSSNIIKKYNLILLRKLL